jgi:hypothetical protein
MILRVCLLQASVRCTAAVSSDLARSPRGSISWQALVVSVSPTSLGGAVWLNPCHGQLDFVHCYPQPEIIMGKYVLGWILGVPAIVLVIAYFFFH